MNRMKYPNFKDPNLSAEIQNFFLGKGKVGKISFFKNIFSSFPHKQFNLEENLFRFLGKAVFLNIFYNFRKILPFLISKFCGCDVYTCHTNFQIKKIDMY